MTAGTSRARQHPAPADAPAPAPAEGPLEVAVLRAHLVSSRIAGDVATPREDNLRNISRMAQALPAYAFGLTPNRVWTPDEVLAVMAERCGVHADPAYLQGPDTIDPDLTLAQLERWRARLARAAAGRERVLLATGHPTGILAVHLQVAAALRAAGCEVLVAAPDWTWPWPDARGGGTWRADRPRHVRSVNGVHLLASGGELLHTHDPEPMVALLGAVAGTPDLVVADHGWAGAAAQVGLDVLAMADCNDPALFIAEQEGLRVVTVPLDDNVAPHLYDPLSAFLTHWRPKPPRSVCRTTVAITPAPLSSRGTCVSDVAGAQARGRDACRWRCVRCPACPRSSS